MAGNNTLYPNEPPHPQPLRQSSSSTQNTGSGSAPQTSPHASRANQRHGQSSRNDGLAVPSADNSHDESSEDQQRTKKPSRQSDASGRSRASIMTDAKKWFDNSNNNPTGAFDVSPPDATLVHANTRSSSSEDYRSVIDDLTIENKRLKEQLKRFQQNVNRDVLENEKLFEIKMHGLPRRKKQELEATLRDFAASLGDTASNDSASLRKREKSLASSKDQSQQPHHHHHHHHHNNSALYSSNGSRSKQASNSSSRSRPVDSAYASMSTGANSSGTSLTRHPFGGSKARASSEQKVERYLKDIPEGLYPYYGFNTLGDKEKKKLIVRRLEQLFTGKIGGRYTGQAHSTAPDSSDLAGTTTIAAAIGDRSAKNSGALNSDSRSGSSGEGGSAPAVNAIPYASTPAVPGSATAKLQIPTSMGASEPSREARIQARTSGHKQAKSHDNGSASNSNGEEAGNGNGNGSGTVLTMSGATSVKGNGNGSGSGSGNGNGNGKSTLGSSLPDQRPTRLLDLDPDRVQVPADNMEYIRHLGLIPPEIGPQSVAKTIDVSPDADGWVYLNLLANLAQLHILNVAPDFIRQSVVEKSTKFQLSPDGQKIRWRGGMDGTKFSSDGGSTGDLSQHSQSTDVDDGSDETGQRKRAKKSGNGSASALSSSKKQSKTGLQDSAASSSFQYKPLFVHRNSVPILTSGEEMSSQESDQPETSHAFGSRMDQSNTKSRNRNDAKSRSKSNNSISNSNNNSNSNIDASRYGTSRSGSSNTRKRRKSDGVLVYYSGMPFCTDLAGDSSGEVSPATNETSTLQTQDSMDEPLQNRPTVHRSSSGSHIPFRPLTDYLSLSRDEWAGLGLLGIGTVGRRNEPAASANDNVSSSASFISSMSNQDDIDDDLVVFDYSSATDASSVDVEEPKLEASGIHRVFPEDHFALRVTTQRPFHSNGSINNCEDDDDCDKSNLNSGSTPSGDTFSIASLTSRVAALKKQTAPVSAAVAMTNKAPSVRINYVSAIYQQREPAKLPRPAMFYPPFSSTSESEEDTDMLDEEGGEEEDESMLASSSVISRRANPHHSVNNASLASHAVMSSGEDGDVEADEAMELEDST
ncbi:hypothetical protein Sste5346_003104 [Sporothrix stenoceras]|uniref:Frequency clock protein n=1 Tax=Sporothrix stenoceras TaxID=5173 RepID=A0ABR3ZFU3_9PEZI